MRVLLVVALLAAVSGCALRPRSNTTCLTTPGAASEARSSDRAGRRSDAADFAVYEIAP